MKLLNKKDRSEVESRLINQIRLSYLILLLPNIIFMFNAFYNLWLISERYNEMLNSVVVASEFSLDFKDDFDYETYLLIVGNVKYENSNIPTLLSEAGTVVEGLKEITDDSANKKRLSSAEKYLTNLGNYIDRINSNLEYGDRYEKNMLIWENDVQIVTALFKETINEYIYYENKQIQREQAINRQLYLNTVKITVGIFGFIIVAIIVVSIVGPLWITKPIKEQVTKEQKLLRKAEFDLLQAQINPHFLYNTLDAIVWSAEAGNQKQVVNMVGCLSDFFRLSLNNGREIVSIGDELSHVRSYLAIQQIRYQDILKYEVEVPKELFKYEIPKITIQPIIENAIYHGIKNKRGGGKITVTGEESGDNLIISISDDGIGMDPDKLLEVKNALTGNSTKTEAVYGLYNVNERIKLNFGEEYGLTVESVFDSGTTVTIKLPKNSNKIVENSYKIENI
jgi:two-component system sensor histidine kinase YesM